MRSTLLLLAVLFAIAASPNQISAQTFGFNTAVHVNRPDFHGMDGLVLWATRDFTSFGLGWRGELHLNQHLSVQTGVDYNHYQYMFTTQYRPPIHKGPAGDYRHYLQMSEFQIPVLLRWNLRYTKDSVVYYAIGGVARRNNPNARMTIRPTDNNTPVYDDRLSLPIANRRPWGTLCAGFGLEIRGVHKRVKPFLELMYRQVSSPWFYRGTLDGGQANQFLGQRMLMITFGFGL